MNDVCTILGFFFFARTGKLSAPQSLFGPTTPTPLLILCRHHLKTVPHCSLGNPRIPRERRERGSRSRKSGAQFNTLKIFKEKINKNQI